MDSSLKVRPPHVGEAAQMAQVHVRAWAQAYSGVMPEQFWDQEALEARTEFWNQTLADPQQRSRTRVAEANGAIVGLAQVGPPRDSDVDVAHELHMIYLLEEHHRSSAASTMLTDLLADESASLWVFKRNPRAQAFYRKHGFEPDGEEIDLGGGRAISALAGIMEIRMTRPGRPATQSAWNRSCWLQHRPDWQRVSSTVCTR